MSWFKKLVTKPEKRAIVKKGKGIPQGIWTKCEGCQSILYQAELIRDAHVCNKCDHHMYMPARQRLEWFLDAQGQQEHFSEILPKDPLKFKDRKRYKDRLIQTQESTSESDALLVFSGALNALPVVACAFEFRFIGGSMGAVVGERFYRAVELCLKKKCPLVCFSSSGGARMQEGLISLMQMAKTSAVLKQLSNASLPYISVLCHPTMGGVSASLATLGDIIIAEPDALIGFAGPRVIQETVRETLPEGFQRSDFLLKNGVIDQVVKRNQQRAYIGRQLMKLMNRELCESERSLTY